MTDPSQSTTQGVSSARVMSIIGIVLAGIALILFPPVFGIAAAVLGFVANAKGDRPFGMYVGIAGIVCGVVGMILGAIVFNATT